MIWQVKIEWVLPATEFGKQLTFHWWFILIIHFPKTNFRRNNFKWLRKIYWQGSTAKTQHINISENVEKQEICKSIKNLNAVSKEKLQSTLKKSTKNLLAHSGLFWKLNNPKRLRYICSAEARKKSAWGLSYSHNFFYFES